MGEVYFIKSELSDAVKIGYSENPQERARGLTLPGTEVIASIPGDRAKERELQRRFEHLQIEDSEWFEPGSDLESYITGLGNGDASPGAFADAVADLWKCADELSEAMEAINLWESRESL